ncbi:MFS transporter [Gorillibacterium sp. CAU 1737]|uniref:MFS transporter n=1 Tax=Gorillibacterium sp. CAU 1737 TaxID=3140362 RepID=UPI00326133F7
MALQKEGVSTVSGGVLLLLAAACGFIVANLYYAQPLIEPIAAATGLSSSAAGLIVTLTQLGYVLGLLFLVPLSDLVENRKLAVLLLGMVTLSLAAAAFVSTAALFLIAAAMIGLGSVVAQILVPYAAHLASEEDRGRVVGNVMAGLMLGILFARPVASFLASSFSWRTVFLLSAGIMAVLMLVLAVALPARKPIPVLRYPALIRSLGTLYVRTPILRRRALYQACLFGAFSLFWTVIPLRLSHDFGLTQQGIAWFALAGVGGAVASPIAGRLADRGWTHALTGAAFVLAILSLTASSLIRGHSPLALGLLVAVAILLDMAVSGNLVLGQRAIYSLGQETRGRMNGLFMATFFVGGALGSSLGAWAYAQAGWPFAALIAIIPITLALLYFLVKDRA